MGLAVRAVLLGESAALRSQHHSFMTSPGIVDYLAASYHQQPVNSQAWPPGVTRQKVLMWWDRQGVGISILVSALITLLT